MSTMGKTFESLRETLQQTLEEKQRTEEKYLEDCKRLEQKYAEDCLRIEQNLAELKNMISTYTAELQSLEYNALKVQPDALSDPVKRPQADYQPPHKPMSPTLTAEDVRRIMQEGMSKSKDSFSFKLGGNGKIVWYVVGTILMFIILFFLASLFEKPKETSHVFPALMNSAEACAIAGRIHERVQERRSTADSVPVAMEEQSECDVPCDEAKEGTKAAEVQKKREPRRPVRALLRSMIRR